MKLTIQNGGFGYHDRYLFSNINLTVNTCEVLAILGPNGIGKTTLLKCMMNMLPWKEGYATLNDTDISEISVKMFWKQVAYVPQAKSSACNYSVRDMVVLGRSTHVSLYSQPDKNDEDVAERAMETLNIAHLASRSCRTLSGGEMQLVLIARALAGEPKILIMDEPESNLDFHNQLMILDKIRELSKTMTCIINTHYPEHALRISDKSLLFMGGGESIYGTTRDIITEENLRNAFNVNVKIGYVPVKEDMYHYILPLSIME
jgi:iron complex transport system ATP-binding protein